MSQSNKFTFKEVFMLTNFSLWINGSHPGLSFDLKWALRSFVTITISSIILFILCNSIIHHRIPNEDYTDVVRETIMALLAFTLLAKYTIIVYNKSVVFNLICSINDDFDIAANLPAIETKIVSEFMKRGKKSIKIWICCGVASGSVFAVKGMGSTIYYHCVGTNQFVQIFDLVLPDRIDSYKSEPLGYIIFCGLILTFELYAMCVYIGFEPLISIFLLHCCSQLEILCLRMKNVFSKFNDSEDILNEIKAINAKLQSIYKFAEDVQNTFVPLFEFTMKTTTIGIPFTVFCIVQSFREHVINVEFLCLLVCVLLQFYLPCYYSNHLMEKSEDMRQAIYSCGWEKEPNPKVRKLLLFMLTRTTKPVVLNTFFYPLCLETFAEMCRQAYAIYNIMTAVWG